MELGAWVHAHKLNVRVMEFCFCSCANYVFPAAVKKTVSNFAMVRYHGGPGGPLQIELDDALTATQRKAFLDDIEKQRAQSGRREAEFYRTIGVRTDLSTLGQGHQSALETRQGVRTNAGGDHTSRRRACVRILSKAPVRSACSAVLKTFQN